MSFDGDLYPEAGASKVITSKGDLVRGNASGDRERYGIGSTNQILQVKSGTVSWETLSTAGSILTTQGDILFQDASGLQRLAAGTSGDFLKTQGTGADPVWASAGSDWTLLDSTVLTSSGNLQTGTFAAKNSLYCQIYAAQTTTTNQTVKVNNDNSALYNWRGQANNGTQSARSAVSNGIIYLYDTSTSSNFALAQMFISNDADSKKLFVINTTESNGIGNTVPNQEFCFGSWNDTTNQITSIQWGDDGASLTNAAAGSYIIVYGSD